MNNRYPGRDGSFEIFHDQRRDVSSGQETTRLQLLLSKFEKLE